MEKCPAGKCECTLFEKRAVTGNYCHYLEYIGMKNRQPLDPTECKRCPYEPVPPAKTPEAKLMAEMKDCILKSMGKYFASDIVKSKFVNSILADIAIQLPRHGFKHIPPGGAYDFNAAVKSLREFIPDYHAITLNEADHRAIVRRVLTAAGVIEE